jgi:murein L,D-transpeptidase YafK
MNIILKFNIHILVSVIALFLMAGAVQGEQFADLVIVEKSESRLYLMKNGQAFASFRVAFGGNPEGHKLQQGDRRTPEGKYLLDYKNANSLYYKSIHISYPNEQDRQEARRQGVDPGGDIMIHGQKNGYEGLSFLAQWFNWTNGCIALTNKDMDSVWEAVPPGTPIEIRP